MRIERPTELQDLLGYIFLCAPDQYPVEDYLPPDKQPTNASEFATAFEALQRFTEAARTEEGKEKLRECERNLRVAYELFEHGNEIDVAKMVQETEQMFLRARKYIPISDE